MMWWLSFCDPDKPEGTQFIGACIVEADDIIAATMLAHCLGINPGGEVAGVAFDRDPPDKYVNVLMDKEMIADMDRGGKCLSTCGQDRASGFFGSPL
jgi:hypothetical protein